MAIPTPVSGEGKKRRISWRTIVFITVAALAGLLYLTNLPLALSPWLPTLAATIYGYPYPELNQWHNTIQGVVSGLLFSGTLLALLWQPRERPLLMQYVVVGALVAILTNIFFIGPLFLILALPAILTIIAYPAPRALLSMPKMASMSRLLLGLTILAVILLVPLIGRELIWQIQGVGGEQASTAQWSSDVEHTLGLLLAALFASAKRPGWSILGLLTGVAFLFLGIAALSIPNQVGSWGSIGGILGILGGLSYLAVTLFEMRQARQTRQAAGKPTTEVIQAAHTQQ